MSNNTPTPPSRSPPTVPQNVPAPTMNSPTIVNTGGGDGNMGLKGLWAAIANSTALTLLAVVLFWTMFQVNTMHKEGMSLFERLHEQERESTGHNMQRMGEVIDRNTAAVRELSDEMKRLRQRTKD